MLSLIRVVLVSPKFSANVGACARVCANFGVRDLRVVAPRCDWRSPEAAVLATGASDRVLAEAREQASLREALADCAAAVGFTRRSGRYRQPRRALGELASTEFLARFERAPLALVFGAEDFGLSAEELDLCTEVATIPTAPELESMNLSHAVAVALARLFEGAAAAHSSAPARELASHAELETLFTHWEGALVDAGITGGANPDHMAQRIREILKRADLSPADVALLRGYLSKTQVALGTRRRGASG